MLEHELLNAAPIVTGTHRLLGFLSRLFEGQTGSIHATGTDGEYVAVGHSQGERSHTMQRHGGAQV
jgi:hypothetical protein